MPKWSADRDVLRPFKVSTYTDALKRLWSKSPEDPNAPKTSTKPWKEQNWKERLATIGRGAWSAVKVIGKSIASTGIVIAGAVMGGVIGGLQQTVTGVAQILSVVPGALFDGKYWPDGFGSFQWKLAGRNLLEGFKNFGMGFTKFAVGSVITGTIAFAAASGVGAPVAAFVGPAVSALATIPVVGSTLGATLSGMATAGTAIAAGLTTGGAVVASGLGLSVAPHIALATAATVAAAGGGTVGIGTKLAVQAQQNMQNSNALKTSSSSLSEPVSRHQTDELASLRTVSARQSQNNGPPTNDPVSFSPTQTSNRALQGLPLAPDVRRELEERMANINQKTGTDGTLAMQEGVPTISGKDPARALANCEERALQQLSWTLKLPAGSTREDAMVYLASAKDAKISKVVIGTDEYRVQKKEGGGYTIDKPDNTSAPSTRKPKPHHNTQ